MKYHLLFLLICINLHAQSPLIDGVVDSLEWAGASRFSIGYEIEPADNAAAPYNTDVFITTTPTDILVGFIAQADMSNLRSSVRSRDQINDDENVAIGIDTYGDGRAMIVLGSNPEGSQFDIKILPDGSSDDYNMAFETLTSKHKDSYHVEFRIPIRNFSFSSDDTQRWKLVFGRNSYVGTIRTQFLSFPYDRTNPCVVCQSTDELVLRNISIKKEPVSYPMSMLGNRVSEMTMMISYKTQLKEI